MLDDLGEVKTKVEITPIKIEPGAPSDLAGYDIEESTLGIPGARGPAEEASLTPHYVTVRFKNVGDGVPEYFAPEVGIDAVTGAGSDIDTSTVEYGVGADFKPCPLRPAPRRFSKGDAFETCLTFLVAQSTTFRGIAWEAHDLPDGGILWEP